MRSTASLTAHSFVGQCFSPGQATGQDVLVELVPGSLVVCLPDGQRLTAPLSEVQLSRGGFNAQQWQFSWRHEGGQWMIALSDLNAQQRLRSKPPVGLEKQLAALSKVQRKANWVARIGWSVLVLVILTPLILLGLLWWQADRIASWATDRITVEQEAALGQAVFEAQKSHLRLIEQSPLQAPLEEMGQRLTKGSAYRYQWYLTDDPAINAFAIPGGIVVVNSGLVKASSSPEELAGVLAHEVQHVEQRHSLKGMVQNLGLAAIAHFALGDYSGSLPAQMATELADLKFSRDHERDADNKGFDTLLKADINPQGMVSMFEKLDQASGSAPPALLSSHPDTQERIAHLRTRLAGLQARKFTPLPYPWPKLKQSLAK